MKKFLDWLFILFTANKTMKIGNFPGRHSRMVPQHGHKLVISSINDNFLVLILLLTPYQI